MHDIKIVFYRQDFRQKYRSSMHTACPANQAFLYSVLLIKYGEHHSIPVVPKACSADPKGSAISCHRIREHSYVKATLRCASCFFN